MMIFKKAIPRRAFLRGLGATIALPLLDGMVPAFAGALDSTAKPVSRLGFVYLPNGIIMEKWTPAAEGTAFELTPILEPLTPFRDRMLVLSGLSHNGRDNLGLTADVPGDHSIAGATYLTGIHPKKSTVRVGTSLDQIVAQEFGKHTQLGSLELSLDSSELVGACEGNSSCTYTNTLSWRTATTPNPMEDNPRVVFERLFGDTRSTDPKVRADLLRRRHSILDSVNEEASQLASRLVAGDRAKVAEYLDAVRDTERRIQVAEEQSSRELPRLDRPAGVPANFEEHAKLMFDLQVLAFQSDLTRVITFMFGRELTGRTYSEIGISDPHHPLTHHNGDPEKIAKVLQINIYHAKTFAYYLEKLRSTPDGDGSLLDHLILVYGGSLSDGNVHAHNNLPVVLFGGAAGGRHIRFPKEKEIPMSNLWLRILDKLGLPVENFGDSTGKLELLSV